MKMLKKFGQLMVEFIERCYIEYFSFITYAFEFPEMEKGDFNDQLLVHIREDVGKQIIEDGPYGNIYTD
jgi:hypothetical protein